MKITRALVLSFFAFVLLPLAAEEAMPEIIGEAAIAIDVKTGEVIYAREIDKQLFPASITKLMTALLLAENKTPGDILEYSALAKGVYPYKLDLMIGERMSAANAMDTILLFSANDIAYMIAENVAGDADTFITLMNGKAQYLGMKNTHFITPSGLHNEEHYSTAYDITLLLRELYKYPWIMESTNKKEATITTLLDSSYEVENRNKLVTLNGCIGGKTGWTPEAGRCLAALYERGGRKIAAVVLNSEYDMDDTVVFRDMENLMHWCYHRKRKILYSKGTIAEILEAEYNVVPYSGLKQKIIVPLLVRSDIKEYSSDPDFKNDIRIQSINPWELNKDESIGEIIISGREILHRYKLYPQISWQDLIKKHLVLYISLIGGLVFLIILIISLISRFLKKKPGGV